MLCMNLDPGSILRHGPNIVRIEQVLSLEKVYVKPIQPDGKPYVAEVKDLTPADGPTPTELCRLPDLAELDDEQRAFLAKWMPFIQPLADARRCTKEMVEAAARDMGCHPRTIRRRVSQLQTYGVATAILPAKRGRHPKSRNDKELFEFYKPLLLKHIGKGERPPISAVIEDTITDVKQMKGVPLVPNWTLRRWVKDLDRRFIRRRRYSRQEAEQVDTARPRTYDEAKAPFDVIQIDHTVADLIIVDPVHRLPIGRPYLTLAIDVYSRCIPSYYLSLDPPDTTAVAITIALAMMPKEDLLVRLGVDGSWPIYGPIRMVSVDGGRNLNAEAIKWGCIQHGIRHFKREGGPHMGGHIESLIGTMIGKIQLMPGTTFSNVQERGDYDSEKEAIYTIEEANVHIAEEIVNGYHCYKHSGIGMPPLRYFERARLRHSRDGETPRHWRPIDGEQLYMDFLPFKELPITRHGITWDHIKYWKDVLGPHVDEELKPKPKFLCRRDPRHLSSISVRLGTGQPYVKIPYANPLRPDISLYEHKQACEELRKEGSEIDEDRIFRKTLRQREIREQAAAKTKKARRAAARRNWHEQGPFSMGAAPASDTGADDDVDARSEAPKREKRWFQDIA